MESTQKAVLLCTKFDGSKQETVWWSAAYQIHYSFLNPGEIVTSEKHAQQIDEMQMKTTVFQQNRPNSPQQRQTSGHTTIFKNE